MTDTLDQSAYRAGWQASHDGQRAQVPTEWLATDAQIDGWIWGWIDYVIAMCRGVTGVTDEIQQLPVTAD